MKTKIETKMKKEVNLAEAECHDVKCPFHGNLKTRGKTFEGTVIKKLNKRVAIEFERMIFIRKYERFTRFKTKIHSRLSPCMENKIQIGDLIRVQECRPLSKIIHSVVIAKIKGKDGEIKWTQINFQSSEIIAEDISNESSKF